jgi:hypothetical protein
VLDRVHDVGAWVHGTSLNMSRSSGDLRPGLNEPKGYLALLILVVYAGMDGPRWLGRQGRCDCGSAPGLRRWLTGVGRYPHSGPLNTMRSLPMTSGRCGELSLLSLCWRRVMVAASDGDTPCSSPRVDVRWLQGFSRLQNQRAAAATAPWTHDVLWLWWESAENWAHGRLRFQILR